MYYIPYIKIRDKNRYIFYKKGDKLCLINKVNNKPTKLITIKYSEYKKDPIRYEDEYVYLYKIDNIKILNSMKFQYQTLTYYDIIDLIQSENNKMKINKEELSIKYKDAKLIKKHIIENINKIELQINE